ncbi:MAG: hypothetical protein JWP97_451 [Labilithrix sp.]|nr:hypothetical protein [Labilithrix sp.]
MTTDLWCLVANALWGLVLVFTEVGGKTRAGGVEWNAGNRDTEPRSPEWVARAGRALVNHKENFPLFLTAVLVVHVAGRADHVSAMAAVAYVILRALHAVVYIAGIPKLRSAMFAASLAAIFVILSRLL